MIKTLTGKMSTFGGPDDGGVGPDEDLALVSTHAQFEQLRAYFLEHQPHGTTGYARRLNTEKFYIACRWKYSETPQAFLRAHTVTVTVKANGKTAQAQPIDYGPNFNTGRVADLSPGLAHFLGLETNDVCTVEIPLPTS